ncbi:MAG: hypothetical protein ACXWJ8_10150 [Xanthobacteraceae bacterium]
MHATTKKSGRASGENAAVPIFGPRQTFGIDNLHYRTVIDDTLRHPLTPLGIRTDATIGLASAQAPQAPRCGSVVQTIQEPLAAKVFHSVASGRLDGLAVDHLVSEAELARAHVDPRFKQVLLARSLEQLLDMLYRNQHLAFDPAGAQSLRDGAAMAVRLADQIRAIDDRLSVKMDMR